MAISESPLSPSTTFCAEAESVPRLLYVVLAKAQRWDLPVVRKLWDWCRASPNPAVQRFVETTAKGSNIFAVRDQQVGGKIIKRYIEEDLTARFLIEALEGLHDTQRLTRQEATGLQERILNSTDRYGRWKL